MKRCLVAFAFALVSAVAEAQDGSPAEDRAAAFRAVEGAEVESVDGGALMVAAYGTILVLLLGYVLYLARLQAGTSAEVARLAAALKKAPAGGTKD